MEDNQMSSVSKLLAAWYAFDNEEQIGKDQSGRGNHASVCGSVLPSIQEIGGRSAVSFSGGENGTGYIQLPKAILENVSDETGITICAWVYGGKAHSVWERILDFGAGEAGPYLFLTRSLRGVCFNGEDHLADSGYELAEKQWTHVAFTVSGTKGGTESSAGPRIYMDGELIADGMISQTSSGTYRSYREWWESFAQIKDSEGLYIGRSQFGADPDFCGAVSNFCVYEKALTEGEILSVMCEDMTPEQILKLAKERFLPKLPHVLTRKVEFPTSLMDGRIKLNWSSAPEDLITADGIICAQEAPVGAVITAELVYGEYTDHREYPATVMSVDIAPSEITVYGKDKVCDVSKTLYGLFFEDINHSADGGIYAELIQNRSFEEFEFDTYDAKSGENGISTGRRHDPLKYWFGDLDGVTVRYEGGLRDFFGFKDPDINAVYIEAKAGTDLINHGFCDETLKPSLPLYEGERYDFSIWAKAEKETVLTVTMLTAEGVEASNSVEIAVDGSGIWKKYTAEELISEKTGLGQIRIHFAGNASVDMVSLMPRSVWGTQEADGESARNNYNCNSNYRLRRDLVQTLKELHPSFLRFPGGCISEGSYIWDNVYDWKDSIGPVECRKENYNVWGYTMTMGLGYMEYFQLAEDLNAEPLPVMACGVLCQARSDYANPAGGALREKYIQNFIDLIDFAISTDFEKNQWAAVRRELGHEAPFGLHYLGVGNENWGSEFYANFEAFYARIDDHMKECYPGYDLTIVSTAGAQADDDAYQDGWNFLAGGKKGAERIAFSDGNTSVEELVDWYPGRKQYLDTIVDEHYYRSNEYMLENADRYNYYYRPYRDGKLVEEEVSKVFVGEYASSDKNTLAGAVAEAAVMTGFENNSDVVRLAATAPLFNKIGGDGTYRWTPDCIWFDDETVWRTPNYYVQQMFAENLGTETLRTGYESYVSGEKTQMKQHGNLAIFLHGEVAPEKLTVTRNSDHTILFEQDFSGEQKPEITAFDGGFYLALSKEDDSCYSVEFTAECLTEGASFSIAAGITGEAFDGNGQFDRQNVSMHEYCVGAKQYGTGLKVYKDGKEGYTMGDYSSSVYAGNLRRYYMEELEAGTSYSAKLDFGGDAGNIISGSYAVCGSEEKVAAFDAKLEYYNRDIYNSVTADDTHVYMKLVNPSAVSKRCRIHYQDVAVADGTWISLFTENEAHVHAQNVNTREQECVAPVSCPLILSKDENGVQFSEIVLAGQSVNVLVLKKVN
jgi:alpha-L-arabinofuranosidase